MARSPARILRRLLLALGSLALAGGIGLFGYFIFRPQQIPEGGTLAVAAKKAAGERSVTLTAPAFADPVLCQARIHFDYATDTYVVTTKSAQFGRYTTRTAGFNVRGRLVVADAGGSVLHEEAFTLRDNNTERQPTPSGELYEKGTNSAGSGMVGKAAYKLHSFRAPVATPLTVRLELPADAPRNGSKPPQEQHSNVGTIGALELQLYRDVADVAAYREQNVEGPTRGLWLAGGGLLLLVFGLAIGRRPASA